METTTYPDIERAANTILSRSHPRHPVLQTWIWHIARDASFQASLEEVTEEHYRTMLGHRGDIDGYPDADVDPEWTLANTLREGGYPRPTEGYPDDGRWSSLLLRHHAHPATPGEGDTMGDLVFDRCQDDALTRLAWAVVEFRRAGRPTGDQTHDIMGLGSPVAYLTTSLAAAVADHVERMADAWAIRLQAADDRA